MARLLYGLVALSLIGITEAKAQTQAAATVAPAMQDLKFEYVKPTNGNIGGPQEYKFTDATEKKIKDKSFWVTGDGSITFEDPKSKGAGATENQALVGAALQKLHFHFVKPKDGTVGGDQEYKADDKTVKFLTEKKRFWIDGDGSVVFKEPK